jgi:hypothetical protein
MPSDHSKLAAKVLSTLALPASWRNLVALGAVLTLTIPTFSLAQGPAQGQAGAPGGGSGHRRRPRREQTPPVARAVFVPIHILRKTCSFPVIEPPSRDFILMASESVTIPKNFGTPGSPPRQAILLTYSYVKGGVVRVYETKAAGVKNGGDYVMKIRSGRIFNDIPQTPQWTLAKTVKKGVWVVATGLSSAGNNTCVSDISFK